MPQLTERPIPRTTRTRTTRATQPKDTAMKNKTSMGQWKAKKIRQQGKRSVTPGNKKGENCMTDKMKNFFAKRSRSYKHPDYAQWCDKMDVVNKRAMAG